MTTNKNKLWASEQHYFFHGLISILDEIQASKQLFYQFGRIDHKVE